VNLAALPRETGREVPWSAENKIAALTLESGGE